MAQSVNMSVNTNSAGQMRLVTIKNSLSDLRLMSCPILTRVHPHKGVIIPGFAPPHLQWQMVWPFSAQKNQPHREDKELVASPWRSPPSLCCWAGMQRWRCSSRWGWRLGGRSAGCRWRPPGRRWDWRGSRGSLHSSPCLAKVNKERWWSNIRVMSSDWWQQVFPERGTQQTSSAKHHLRRYPNQPRTIKNKPYGVTKQREVPDLNYLTTQFKRFLRKRAFTDLATDYNGETESCGIKGNSSKITQLWDAILFLYTRFVVHNQ